MGLADLHIHTNYSWDSTCTVSAILKYTAEFTNLNLIAITDHDQITGALEAVQRAPFYGVEVIPGIEITTADGHLIALFVNEIIPAGMSLTKTVLRVGELGGLCIAPHPMAMWACALSEKSIREALKVPGVAEVLVGIEAYNAGLIYRRSNKRATALSRELPLASVGSSDSHMLITLGSGATEFPGGSATDLRRALETRQTQVCINSDRTGLHILVNWAPRMMLRKAGWIAWNEHPSAPIRFSRMKRVLISSQHYLASHS
jgi:predicted metal-dependent phosphoesterase TrpH